MTTATSDTRLPQTHPYADRLLEVWEETGDGNLYRLSEGRDPEGMTAPHSEQARHDAISSCLMDCYKNTGDTKAFALLFELNRDSFLSAIQNKVRRGSAHVDPQDVLQEVFLNIYRYPRRFLCDRPDAFRNWGHRIVRNTLLKFLKGETRLSRFTPLEEDMGQKEDQRAKTPYRTAADSERAELVDFTYLVYLNLYLLHYGKLSAKEQRALQMVEVEGASYKSTAAALGIRLENLKMVIFRGRRKIFRGMSRTLQTLASPCALEVSAN
jgi:RNA polymerase sigma factor (sigma-70 family)